MIRNHPGAYGLFAGLLVLLLGALLNVSCCSVVHPIAQYDTSKPRRTPEQQAHAAVSIHTECGSGSGVLVSSTQVITANHVTLCGGAVAHFIAVRTFDGKSRVAFVEIADTQRDLARMKLDVPLDATPISIRFATLGERVCSSTARPERAQHCGTVYGTGGPLDIGDIDVSKMNTWYGNSGSGVYSSDGMLVGIAVRMNWCSVGDALFHALTDTRVDTCGGRVSSISDSTVRP